MLHYAIRSGYKVQETTGGKPIPFRDSRRRSLRSQSEVYRMARDLAARHSLDSVVDLGCGLGYKLAKFIRPICSAITGIDCPEAIAYCKRRHRFGRWIADDIEDRRYSGDPPFDLIIAADVVEHLVNPDLLLEYIKSLAHPQTTIVISTPERDRVRGRSSLGPPENQFHMREWNSEEFCQYLTESGLTVARHEVAFCDKPTRLGRMRAAFWFPRDSGWHCQVAVCQVTRPVANIRR